MTFITVVAPIAAVFGHPFGNNVATQRGRGAAEILFLSNKDVHTASLNRKVFGLNILVGAIRPGCLEC